MQALIRPSDLARDLCVSRAWVYDAAKDGRIPSIRIGGADGPLRFVPEDIERWLDAAREGGCRGEGPSRPRGEPARGLYETNARENAGRIV
jgi:predicted DNA-binding transcriptional regulator AlpA